MSGSPRALNEQVRSRLSRQASRDTVPELMLRRGLHAAGVRFWIHRSDLPGSPDIVVPRLLLAVFVDGCFWHRCPLHVNLPRNNAEWWAAKLARNVARDAEKDAALRLLGWDVVHVWEHEDAPAVAAAIAIRWRAARPS